MSTFLGKDGVIKVGSDAIAEVRSFSVTQTSAVAEDTIMGDDWTTHKATLKSWIGQLTCFWDEGDTNGQGALHPGSEVTVNLYPKGDGTGDTEISGKVIITSLEIQLAHDGFGKYDNRRPSKQTHQPLSRILAPPYELVRHSWRY